MVRIELPDISSRDEFSLCDTRNYVTERDYFRSSVNVLRRAGYTFSSGFDCIVRGNIPIQAGTSSSSALVVTWVNFLSQMSDQCCRLSPQDVARYAHEAEVLEFSEPGGMMDHYSTAYGGIITLDFHPELRVEKISADLKTLVLGDSREPKNTKYILAQVKDRVLRVVKHLSAKHPTFSLHEATKESVDEFRNELTNEEYELLIGTLHNRDLTVEARRLLKQHPLDHHRLGAMLTEHQSVLRDVLKISTPKIDRMLDAALDAGAYGGKINGSGGGGCMFAYAPERPEYIAEAIERCGGKTYIVSVDSGTRIETVNIS